MSTHAKQLGKNCKKQAAKRWGHGWDYLSDEQKQGAIAKEVVCILLGLYIPPDTCSAFNHILEIAKNAMCDE